MFLYCQSRHHEDIPLILTTSPGPQAVPDTQEMHNRYFWINEYVNEQECCLLKEVSKSLATTFGNLIALMKLVGDILLISMLDKLHILSFETKKKFLSFCFLLWKRANKVKIITSARVLCMKETSSATSDCTPNLRYLYCHFFLLESRPEMWVLLTAGIR